MFDFLSDMRGVRQAIIIESGHLVSQKNKQIEEKEIKENEGKKGGLVTVTPAIIRKEMGVDCSWVKLKALLKR